jgi:hypothetical protein
MAYLISAMALLAVFLYGWNVFVIPVSLLGYALGRERGSEVASQAWQWLGAMLLASLLASQAWGFGYPNGTLVLYLGVAALLMWHAMYVGGHQKLREGIRRADWKGIHLGQRDIRLSWLPALALLVFGAFPVLIQNPVTSAISRLLTWAYGTTILRIVMGIMALVYLVGFILTSASMLLSLYHGVRARDVAVESPTSPASAAAAQSPADLTTEPERYSATVVSCVGCRQQLKLPTGKGRIVATCPKCGTQQQLTT